MLKEWSQASLLVPRLRMANTFNLVTKLELTSCSILEIHVQDLSRLKREEVIDQTVISDMSARWRITACTWLSPVSRVRKRASLVAQWLRICLPMQGTRVRALVWEDPTCHGATRPVSHNY